MYHQRQSVLRNASSSFDGLKYFLHLTRTYRAYPKSALVTLLTLTGITTVCTIGFSVASIFSSKVSIENLDL